MAIEISQFTIALNIIDALHTLGRDETPRCELEGRFVVKATIRHDDRLFAVRSPVLDALELPGGIAVVLDDINDALIRRLVQLGVVDGEVVNGGGK